MKMPDDPIILEFLPEFIEDWQQQIKEKFDPYVAEKNTDDMYRLGHTLKGTCFQFGLDHVAEMGIELMEHVKKEDWSSIIPMQSRLLDAFQEAQKFVESHLGDT